MIAHLAGTVDRVGTTSAVIDLSGFGVLVLITPATASELRPGERTRLATSMVVREDSMTLYGFQGEDERDAFELVQTASGVGPKLALAIVSVLTPGDLVAAITAGDVKRLTSVPGVGLKGAQKMVIELREKVLVLEDSAGDDRAAPGRPAAGF